MSTLCEDIHCPGKMFVALKDYEIELQGRQFVVPAVPHETCALCGTTLFDAAACRQIDTGLLAQGWQPSRRLRARES